MFAFKKHNPY